MRRYDCIASNMQLVSRTPRLTKFLTQLQIPATAAAAPLARPAINSGEHSRSFRFGFNSNYVLAYGTTAGAGAATACVTQAAAALPVVYHPLYSAPQLAAGHRFPMQVFRRIYERLLQQGIIKPSQVCWQQSWGSCLISRLHRQHQAAARSLICFGSVCRVVGAAADLSQQHVCCILTCPCSSPNLRVRQLAVTVARDVLLQC